jgi:hypothetical protein
VLWDIDKTLVDIGGISREIYAAAFTAVTGWLRYQIPEPEKRLTDFYWLFAPGWIS